MQPKIRHLSILRMCLHAYVCAVRVLTSVMLTYDCAYVVVKTTCFVGCRSRR